MPTRNELLAAPEVLRRLGRDVCLQLDHDAAQRHEPVMRAVALARHGDLDPDARILLHAATGQSVRDSRPAHCLFKLCQAGLVGDLCPNP